jgi:hypothetical protein
MLISSTTRGFEYILLWCVASFSVNITFKNVLSINSNWHYDNIKTWDSTTGVCQANVMLRISPKLSKLIILMGYFMTLSISQNVEW